MSPLKIAVIGSGISGLSSAWLLSKHHGVTVFEADTRLGGHANTVECLSPEGTFAVDTGFIVYNSSAYPNLVALLSHLNVGTVETTMGFGVSLDGGSYEYAGSGIGQIIGGAANAADPGHWQMLRDLWRFYRTAPQRAGVLSEEATLGEFVRAEGYSDAFLKRHLLPLAAAIWSAAPGDMMDYPARAFLRFFDNHGLLKFTSRPKWRTIAGGSRQYVRKLVAGSRLQTRMGEPVVRVERDAERVTITTRSGQVETFDHLVIATHADQALAMLADPTPAERRCLSAFRYSHNRAVLHRDPSLMPRRRRLWSSWNYLAASSSGGCAVTYWMNSLQPLATNTNYFVTLNPHQEPAAGTIEGEFNYAHPVFSPEALRQQRFLWELQGQKRTWFCGAHFGSGFHEDGLQAGLAVAEQLGGVSRPWTVDNPSSRIHVIPRASSSGAESLVAAA